MKVAIVGAGIAGLSCANAMRAFGHTVSLFDKGRGPGGRMSTRRLQTELGEVAIDHGAQYFTARDPAFCGLVARWSILGVAKPWPSAAVDAWVGVPGMSAVVREMTSGHDVAWNHPVKGLVRTAQGWSWIGPAGETGPFDAVVLAVPAEQAAVILALHDLVLARLALGARSQPCWAAMYVFDQPLESLPRVIRSGGDIAWATCNSAKPGRVGPESWIVQGSAAWSGSKLEQTREYISEVLLAKLSELADSAIPPPVAAEAHLWRYALSAGTGDGALWNSSLKLGVCGDWLLGPRIECAWLSGKMLAERCNKIQPAFGQTHYPKPTRAAHLESS